MNTVLRITMMAWHQACCRKRLMRANQAPITRPIPMAISRSRTRSVAPDAAEPRNPSFNGPSPGDERRRTHLPTPLIHPDRSPGPFIPDLLRPRAAPMCCRVEGADRIVCDLAEALLEEMTGSDGSRSKDCERAAVADAGLEEKRTRARARVSGEVRRPWRHCWR